MLLLFNFEKKYFDKENIKNTFVGHPLIENNQNNKTIIESILPKGKKIISLFPGSRKSETNVLLPILIDFIKLMNKKNESYWSNSIKIKIFKIKTQATFKIRIYSNGNSYLS